MLLLDAFFRFSGIGMLILLTISVFRFTVSSKSRTLFVLSAISVAGLFLGYVPEPFLLPEPLLIVVRLLDVPHLIFIWLFALSLFQKDFQIRLFHIVVGATYCAPIFMARLAQFGLAPPFPYWAVALVDIVAVAIALHVIMSTLRGRSDDLLQSRREARLNFVIVMVFVTVSAAAIEFLLTGSLSEWLYTAKVMTIWPAIFWTDLWLLKPSRTSFAFEHIARPDTAASDLKDSELHKALLREVVDQQAYLDPELTLPELSNRLAVTQHRLRALINQQMGFRNFSSFINSYRVTAICEAMRLQENAQKSIFELAMDHGFSSLPTFNRSFKSQPGLTPSEFRALHQSD